MTRDIKGDIEAQDQEKDDFTLKSNETASRASDIDHTSTDLEDKYFFLWTTSIKR